MKIISLMVPVAWAAKNCRYINLTRPFEKDHMATGLLEISVYPSEQVSIESIELDPRFEMATPISTKRLELVGEVSLGQLVKIVRVKACDFNGHYRIEMK